jgi:hypothetical protein
MDVHVPQAITDQLRRRGVDDLDCRLGLLAVLTRQCDKPANLAEAKRLVPLLREEGRKTGYMWQYQTFVFNAAILEAFDGATDKSRQLFLHVLEHYPQCQPAKDALELLPPRRSERIHD